MEDNPYASPESQSPTDTPAPSMNPEDHREYLRKVASAQRWVLLSLVAQIALLAFDLMRPESLPQELALVAAVVKIAVLVVTLASIFSLVRVLQGAGVGVIAVVLSLILSVRFFVLLYYNYHATKELRQSGIQVGLMGTNPNDI